MYYQFALRNKSFSTVRTEMGTILQTLITSLMPVKIIFPVEILINNDLDKRMEISVLKETSLDNLCLMKGLRKLKQW